MTTNDVKKIIAANIRRYREQADMTQKELGLALGFKEETAQSRIYQYESGDRSPNKRTLQQIADILRKPIQALLTDPSRLYETPEQFPAVLNKELWLLREEAAKYGPESVRKIRKMLPLLFEQQSHKKPPGSK